MTSFADFSIRDQPKYNYVQLADHIAGMIAAGDLSTGARLPDERSLAAMTGTSVGTVRRTRQELIRRALVRVLPSKGTYVIGTPRHCQDLARDLWAEEDA